MTPEALARLFHERYEFHAREQAWNTQQACRVAYDDLPEANRRTMEATCRDIIAAVFREDDKHR